MHSKIEEGKAVIKVPIVKTVSKEMDVFYNPVMKLNRDISILLLNSIDMDKLNIADPLAGSGIRAIRFLKELERGKIKTISINDYSDKAIKSIKNNLKLNKVKVNNKKQKIKDFPISKSKDFEIIIKNMDANLFLLHSEGFNYIDIDPFGTPNPYLDSAVRRISREGILAITATDTSALCGTYPKACARKYWAVPLRNELMHEVGIRILIRKCQLIGAQYDKALIPVFSYSKDHYMRIFFRCVKGKTEVDNVLKLHGDFEKSGPIWKGQLWDKKLVDDMHKSINNISINIKGNKKNKKIIFDESLIKFLGIIKEESKVDTIGFYDMHRIVKRNKIKIIPKKLDLIKKIKKLGHNASETHFSGTGIRSDIGLKKLLKLINN
jgi:tRNA (guanine26-N2/guanine27-N2)-dimethyltransferase